MTFLKPCQKVVAGFAAVCFLTSLTTPPPSARAESIELKGPSSVSPSFVPIGIPSELASIEEVFLPRTAREDAAPLIHIQSVHSHPETQRKIYSLLKFLDAKYGIRSLFVEGAAENLDPSYFQFFDDPRLNVRVAEKLIDKGELTGAELFLVESDKKIPAYGLEDPALYQENLMSFQSVMTSREITERFAGDLHGTLDRLETLLLAPEARRLLRSSESFDAGRLQLLSYLFELERHATTLLGLDLRNFESQAEWPQLIRLLRLQELETKLEPEKIQADRERLASFLKGIGVEPSLVEAFENLSFSPSRSGMVYDPGFHPNGLPRYLAERLVLAVKESNFAFEQYPYFTRFLEAAILQSELEAERLFNELEKLHENLTRAVSPGEDDWRLVESVKKERLLERVFDLELTTKDYAKIRRFNENDRPLIRFLLGIESLHEKTPLGPKKIIPENIRQVESIYGEAVRFYQLAKEREETMAERILSQAVIARSPAKHFDGETKQSATSETASASLETPPRNDNEQGVSVLITGGFHTEGLSRLFREKQISYTVLSPRITEKVSPETYVSSLLGEKKTAFDVQYLDQYARAETRQMIERMLPRNRRLAMIRAEVRNVLETLTETGEMPVEEFVYKYNQTVYAKDRRSELRLEADGGIVPYLDGQELPNAFGKSFRIGTRPVVKLREYNAAAPIALAPLKKSRRAEVRAVGPPGGEELNIRKAIRAGLNLPSVIGSYQHILENSPNSPVDLQSPQPQDTFVFNVNGNFQITRRIGAKTMVLVKKKWGASEEIFRLMRNARIEEIKLAYGELLRPDPAEPSGFFQSQFLAGILEDLLIDMAHDRRAPEEIQMDYVSLPDRQHYPAHPRSGRGHNLLALQSTPPGSSLYTIRLILGPYSGLLVDRTDRFVTFLENMQLRAGVGDFPRQITVDFDRKAPSLAYPFSRSGSWEEQPQGGQVTIKKTGAKSFSITETFGGESPIQIAVAPGSIEMKRRGILLAAVPASEDPFKAVGHLATDDKFYLFLETRAAETLNSVLGEHNIHLQGIVFVPTTPRAEVRRELRNFAVQGRPGPARAEVRMETAGGVLSEIVMQFTAIQSHFASPLSAFSLRLLETEKPSIAAEKAFTAGKPGEALNLLKEADARLKTVWGDAQKKGAELGLKPDVKPQDFFKALEDQSGRFSVLLTQMTGLAWTEMLTPPSTQSDRTNVLRLLLHQYGTQKALSPTELIAGRWLDIGLESEGLGGELKPGNIVTYLNGLKEKGFAVEAVGLDPQIASHPLFGEDPQHFVSGTVQQMPIGDDAFDNAVSVNFFSRWYFDDESMKRTGFSTAEEFYSQAVREIRRVLKENGKFFLHLGPQEPDQKVLDIFQKAGFKILASFDKVHTYVLENHKPRAEVRADVDSPERVMQVLIGNMENAWKRRLDEIVSRFQKNKKDRKEFDRLIRGILEEDKEVLENFRGHGILPEKGVEDWVTVRRLQQLIQNLRTEEDASYGRKNYQALLDGLTKRVEERFGGDWKSKDFRAEVRAFQLTLRQDRSVMIGDRIRVHVVAIRPQAVVLGVEGLPNLRVKGPGRIIKKTNSFGENLFLALLPLEEKLTIREGDRAMQIWFNELETATTERGQPVNLVRLGFDVPPEIRILRSELDESGQKEALTAWLNSLPPGSVSETEKGFVIQPTGKGEPPVTLQTEQGNITVRGFRPLPLFLKMEKREMERLRALLSSRLPSGPTPPAFWPVRMTPNDFLVIESTFGEKTGRVEIGIDSIPPFDPTKSKEVAFSIQAPLYWKTLTRRLRYVLAPIPKEAPLKRYLAALEPISLPLAKYHSLKTGQALTLWNSESGFIYRLFFNNVQVRKKDARPSVTMEIRLVPLAALQSVQVQVSVVPRRAEVRGGLNEFEKWELHEIVKRMDDFRTRYSKKIRDDLDFLPRWIGQWTRAGRELQGWRELGYFHSPEIDKDWSLARLAEKLNSWEYFVKLMIEVFKDPPRPFDTNPSSAGTLLPLLIQIGDFNYAGLLLELSKELPPPPPSRAEVRSSAAPASPSADLIRLANEVFQKDIKNFDPQLAGEFMQALLKEKAVVDKLVSNTFFGHSLFDLELTASSSYTDAKAKKNVISVATSILSLEEIKEIQDILRTIDQGEFVLRPIEVDHFINFRTIGALFANTILDIRNARSLKDYREVLPEVEKRRSEFESSVIPNLDTHRRGDVARNEAITTAQNHFREVIRKISELEARIKADIDGKGFKGVLPETFEREKEDYERLAEQILEKGKAKTLFSDKDLKDDLELARRFIAFVGTLKEGIAEIQKSVIALNDPQFANAPDYLNIFKRLEKVFQRPGAPSARDRNDLITLAKAFSPRAEVRSADRIEGRFLGIENQRPPLGGEALVKKLEAQTAVTTRGTTIQKGIIPVALRPEPAAPAAGFPVSGQQIWGAVMGRLPIQPLLAILQPVVAERPYAGRAEVRDVMRAVVRVATEIPEGQPIWSERDVQMAWNVLRAVSEVWLERGFSFDELALKAVTADGALSAKSRAGALMVKTKSRAFTTPGASVMVFNRMLTRAEVRAALISTMMNPVLQEIIFAPGVVTAENEKEFEALQEEARRLIPDGRVKLFYATGAPDFDRILKTMPARLHAEAVQTLGASMNEEEFKQHILVNAEKDLWEKAGLSGIEEKIQRAVYAFNLKGAVTLGWGSFLSATLILDVLPDSEKGKVRVKEGRYLVEEEDLTSSPYLDALVNAVKNLLQLSYSA